MHADVFSVLAGQVIKMIGEGGGGEGGGCCLFITHNMWALVLLSSDSLLSRLMSGVATTEPKIDPLTLNMGMMGLCGLFTTFFPLYAGIQPESAPVTL